MRNTLIALAMAGTLLGSPALAQSSRTTTVDGPYHSGSRTVTTTGNGSRTVTVDGPYRSGSRTVTANGQGSRTVTVDGPYRSASRTVTVDSWHRPPPPAAYRGARAGYWYAPGYGYYPVAPRYYGYGWRVGGVVPYAYRRYVVVNPGYYRLPPAPASQAWIYVGNRIALIHTANGTIVRLGPVYW